MRMCFADSQIAHWTSVSRSGACLEHDMAYNQRQASLLQVVLALANVLSTSLHSQACLKVASTTRVLPQLCLQYHDKRASPPVPAVYVHAHESCYCRTYCSDCMRRLLILSSVHECANPTHRDSEPAVQKEFRLTHCKGSAKSISRLICRSGCFDTSKQFGL